MKKLGVLFATIIMVMLFAVSASALEPTGQCGDNVYWSFNESTGELVISGEGAMQNYYYDKSPFYFSSIKSIIIESGVTTIGECAFYDCRSLTSITIPDSVITIGRSAFVWCYSLTSITIPESVTSIGCPLFDYCYDLTSINVDENNPNYSNDSNGVLFNKDKTTLIRYPEGNTKTAYIVPDSVTSIDDYAFSGCSNLTSITIPDSVTSIGNGVFANCSSLISITIPDSVTTIGNSAFIYCSNLTSITISDSVMSIGDYAFSGCGNLTSITIPESVTSIGAGAFDSCYNLTSINVDENNSNYSNDSNGVLFNKDKTILIRYPEGNIRTTYVIPDSVISIGEDAFWGCSNLTSITIPDSVKLIGRDVFNNCYNLTSINVNKNNKNYSNDSNGVLFNKDKTILIRYPEGNTRTTYMIPYSVTSINDRAFYYCRNLTSVTILDSVTAIYSEAFAECTGLTNITIPDSVTSIDWNTFIKCEKLTNVYYYGDEEQWNEVSIDSGNEYLINATIHFNFCVVNLDGKHSYSEIITAPTCTNKGFTTYTCACGNTYKDNYKNALNHNMGDFIVTKEATCTVKGSEKSDCSRCDYSETKEIKALGHNLGDYVVVKESTCTEKGEEKAECTRCDYIKIKKIELKKHIDANGDENCDVCEFYLPALDCLCVCHAKSIGAFLYKLFTILDEIFDIGLLEKVFHITSEYCDCGLQH